MAATTHKALRYATALPVLLVVGAIVSAVGFVLAFTVVPLVYGASVTPELVGDKMIANQLLLSQKIFYFHMPLALISFVALFFTLFFSIRYLQTRDMSYDLRARTATEIALVFILCTMATGVMWTRFEWGVWWTWEPRLTTYLVLMLLAVAYFVLRKACALSEKQPVYAAVFGIITFVDAPICLVITRLVPSSVHPVIIRSDSGLSFEMLTALIICLVGLSLIGFALYQLALRQAFFAQRLSALKDQLEKLEMKEC